MKLRNDSPFAALTDAEQLLILEMAGNCGLDILIRKVKTAHPGLEFSGPALRRFVQRMREEELRQEMEDSGEAMEEFAKSGQSGRTRDGMMEAMRRKMFAEALESADTKSALAVFRTMKEERKEERLVALAERRAALEEENAKQERKRRELEDARSALQLLPQLRSVLTEGTVTAEERLAQAREILLMGGGRLLGEGNGVGSNP